MSGLFGGPKQSMLPPPTVTQVQAPTVNQSQVDRQTADMLRRRKGTQATVGTGSEGTTAGSVAVKSLLGQ